MYIYIYKWRKTKGIPTFSGQTLEISLNPFLENIACWSNPDVWYNLHIYIIMVESTCGQISISAGETHIFCCLNPPCSISAQEFCKPKDNRHFQPSGQASARRLPRTWPTWPADVWWVRQGNQWKGIKGAHSRKGIKGKGMTAMQGSESLPQYSKLKCRFLWHPMTMGWNVCLLQNHST